MLELETWFSGGGLADVGFKNAGLTPVSAMELEPSIASVYAQNLGDHITVADAREYSRRLSDRVPFWFHVSPPCTQYSNANTKGGETFLDIELAASIVQGIKRRSPWFSLENVWQYQNDDYISFKIICKALSDEGYNFAYWHLNSANYGVPQTRKRLILVASRVKRVVQPFPTHSETPDLFSVPWVGWYEAIADLIPELPESQFAPWQIELVPPQMFLAIKPFLVDGKKNANGSTVTAVECDEPCYTVSASAYKQASRAWLSKKKSVAMTSRCLARFQSLPDWYQLTGKNSLDCKIIGNGVPCLLMEQVARTQLAS